MNLIKDFKDVLSKILMILIVIFITIIYSLSLIIVSIFVLIAIGISHLCEFLKKEIFSQKQINF